MKNLEKNISHAKVSHCEWKFVFSINFAKLTLLWTIGIKSFSYTNIGLSFDIPFTK